MDMWVVAAAAGAGYLAKYWQHFLGEKERAAGFTSGESLPDEGQSSSLIDRILDKTCLSKKLPRRRADVDSGDYSGEFLSETSSRDGFVGRDASSYSALNHELEVDSDMSSIPEDSTWEMGNGNPRKASRKSRQLHLPCIKPLNSLDSCLMAQMHRETVELEQYLRTPLSSPCTPTLRPFIVSDGKRIISRPSGEFLGGLYTKVHLKVDSVVVGVPRLPHINAMDSSKQQSNHKNQMEKSHYGTNMMQFNAQPGFSSGQALFCLGISIGILTTIIANKVELDKMKLSLKQSENLVEDLQEELEMKDSLTVKEIVNDGDSLDIHGILNGHDETDVSSNQANVSVYRRYADEKSERLRKDESISNIEAELEAELERLELSMKGSTLSTEFDQGFEQDIIAELVYGELQADTVGRRSSSECTIDRDSDSTSTPHSPKYAVSPRQLSLRLHEVIQSRLEERISELEAELTKSQNQVKQLLSERTNYSRNNSNSGSSSSRCSPRATQHGSQPLVMNLSGDALDAYNEAFEQLNSELVGKREEAVPISITGIPSSEDSPDEDDDDEDDDMLLIMQIVEKARQGSPALFKAQKAMVSLNRNC